MSTPENHYSTRKLTYEHRSYLFVGRDSFLVETTGEVLPLDSLPTYLLRFTGRLCPALCTNDASSLVKILDEKLNNYTRWVWRATPLRRVKRGAAKPKEAKAAVSIHLNPLYCGFKRENGHGTNRYFHFIDCTALTGNTSRYHYPSQDEITSLRTFGITYREFCRANGLSLSSTRGKIGGAFLRDPRFFGDSEKRIPEFINDHAREHLPGNHYELRTEPNQKLEGIYLDITGAHHDAASRIQFPDPAAIRARGKHRLIESENGETNAVDISTEPWAKSGSRKYDAVLRTHGLVAVRALYGGTPKSAILHPASRTATTRMPQLIHAYTNELDLLESSGFTVLGIEAAWTSPRVSDSLNRYARFAQKTLAETSEEHRPWVKQMFLSTYGMLGKRPSKYQQVSNRGGLEYKWPTSEGWLDGGIKTTKREYSSRTANVIALGMIQAETRRNVIETARWLESLGVTVYALYADSLVIGLDVPLPLLPPEWRVKTELTNLRFLNSVSWLSDQEERLPGISRDEALRQSRRQALQARWSAHFGVRRGLHGEEISATRARVPEHVWDQFEKLEDRRRVKN